MGAPRRLGIVICLAIALLLGGQPGSASAAEDVVRFDGSGWGHGVGMSQYGALAMARQGDNYREILSHYYQGTSIDTVPATTSLWVNLEQDLSRKTLRVLTTGSGTANVTISSQAGSAVAPPGSTIEIRLTGSDGCSVTVNDPGKPAQNLTDNDDCSVDFSWYNWSQPGQNPNVKIQLEGCSLADWNTPGGTVFRPCQYARGQLHLRHGAGGLDLVAEMLLDDYVLGISEMPYPWHVEALKVQAVAARSYAQGRRITRGSPTTSDDNGCWCHVRDTTSDQRYVGWGHYQGNGSWIEASNATARQVLTHPDSSIGVITAYYSSSSGGRTEHGHEKGFSWKPVEWLTSVDDSHAVDGTVWNPNAKWTKTVNASTVAGAVGFDSLSSVRVTKRRTSGSALQLEVVGTKNGQSSTVYKTSSWARATFGLKSEYFSVDYKAPAGTVLDMSGDEMLLYRSNGEFEYRSLTGNGTPGKIINSGTNYTTNWKSISAIDLDGDGQDEVLFYRDDGLYRYYEISADGRVGSPIAAGDEYTRGWDSITAVDLDGDGQDEIFFYRADGLYRYYNIGPNGAIGSPIKAGDEYTRGWSSITAVDLEGDGQDEMFFYREDGLFRYYDVRRDGQIGSPLSSGSNYTNGWTAITAVDLEGDGQDEMFFYREDGLFRYYDIRPNASIGSPINSGSNFPNNWSLIRTINLDGR